MRTHRTFNDGPWYRCEQPERHPDPFVRWHYAAGDDCLGCKLGVSILLAEHPDDMRVQWLARQLQTASQ